MNIKTTGRKVTLKQNFLEKIEKRMNKFDKYFSKEAEAAITVTIEGSRQTVEITMRDGGFIYRAERTEQNMEQAFFDAADILDKQITRNKDKLGSRIKRTESLGAVSEEVEDIGEQDEAYRIVREKSFVLNPMHVEEAILQMNMLGHSFFIFQNMESDRVAVVYRRNDGDYGLLLPELA